MPSAASPTDPRMLPRPISLLLGGIFIAWALFYFLSAWFAIRNYAWLQPMFDQWRMYPSLLTNPFPSNVIELENGHRPIIPNLIRLAEVDWFSADQLVQISIGIACAICVVLILVIVAWQANYLPFVARAAASMLAVTGVFWLANARMLMHGNEALHAYLLMLSVVVAALCVYRAYPTSSIRWMIAASSCCVVATFCFGPGIASFPAVIGIGILLRIPVKRIAIVALVFVACLLVYLYVLPSNEGVRGTLALQPWTTFKLSMTWLSSPWGVGWLSSADPPLYPYVVDSFHENAIGSLLVKSANVLVSTSHLSWRTLSMLAGISGTSCFLARTLYIFIKKRPLSLIRTTATTICLFVLTTAFLIGVSRADYFAVYPDQLFADRYLLWPSLFWCGLALLILVDAAESKWRWSLPFYCVLLMALPIALLPMHSNTAGWAAAVYRNAQRLAASARSGVVDRAIVDANAENVDQYNVTLALFRQRNLAMFADRSWQLLHSRWSGSLERLQGIAVSVTPMTPLVMPNIAAPAGHFDGVITSGIDRLPRDGSLVLLDDDNRVVGFAEFSYLGFGEHSLFFSTPRKQGFDGYAGVLGSHAHYRLGWIDTQTNQGIFLADISSS